MILELLNISIGQVFVVVDLLAEHLPQVLVWSLVFACDEFLWELVHEVSSHTYHLSLIELVLDPREILGVILTDVSFQVFILTLQHHVGLCIERLGPSILLIQLLVLRELVALLDLCFLLQDSTKHLLLVEESLNRLSFDGEQILRQRVQYVWVLYYLPLELVECFKDWEWLDNGLLSLDQILISYKHGLVCCLLYLTLRW